MDLYEQKYKDALGKLQEAFAPEEDGCKISGLTRGCIENIFPELKESEEERIRKSLIKAFGTIGKKNWGGLIVRDIVAWLERQGEQTHAELGQSVVTKTSDQELEPKFKVGDWISGYYTNYKVTAIHSKGYVVEDTDGTKINILFENEKFHHLWTIDYAKDGDVLVDVYGNIGIYKSHDYFDWTSYCSLGCNGGFQNFKVEHENENAHPATKEQRNLLFAKMKDAGYDWDAKHNTLWQTK